MPRPACSCPPANAADAGPSDRPGPTAPLADKERWIAGKYVDKWRLARPGGAGGGQQLADWLWDAVARGDIKAGERRAKVDRDATCPCQGQGGAGLVAERQRFTERQRQPQVSWLVGSAVCACRNAAPAGGARVREAERARRSKHPPPLPSPRQHPPIPTPRSPPPSLPSHRLRRRRQPLLLLPARGAVGVGGQLAVRRRRRPAAEPHKPGPHQRAARGLPGGWECSPSRPALRMGARLVVALQICRLAVRAPSLAWGWVSGGMAARWGEAAG